MKLMFGRLHRYGGKGYQLLPRAVFKDEGEAVASGTIEVSLSRAEGSCVFPLAKLEQHDDHAPVFVADGTSPPGSTAPDVTADSYRDRIVEAAKAGGADVTEVETVELNKPADSAYETEGEGEPEGPAPQKGDDWGKYGVN